jgi:hypothetical protein
MSDEAIGIAWWNSLIKAGRTLWVYVAGSAVPADAWRAYRHSSEMSRGWTSASSPESLTPNVLAWLDRPGSRVSFKSDRSNW